MKKILFASLLLISGCATKEKLKAEYDRGFFEGLELGQKRTAEYQMMVAEQQKQIDQLQNEKVDMLVDMFQLPEEE